MKSCYNRQKGFKMSKFYTETKILKVEEPLELDCGKSLKEYEIAYETYGELNEEKKILVDVIENRSKRNRNSDLFINELNFINSKIGAKITYDILDSEFKETKNNHELRLKQMIDKIEDNSQIFADITYGPKPLPMVLMCVLSFAEKFLNFDVKSVVYGKVNFTGENISNPELYDVTSLYYLNNLTSSMVAKDSKDVRKALDEFFAL